MMLSVKPWQTAQIDLKKRAILALSLKDLALFTLLCTPAV